MNSSFLQKKFLSYLKRNNHEFSFENKNVFGKESDIISFKDWQWFEYELKIGESDFRKDIKKNRHKDGKPHYFHYVVSDVSIIKGDHLPYSGIYVHSFSVDGHSSFKLIKEPELIREAKVTDFELYILLKRLHNGKAVHID